MISYVNKSLFDAPEDAIIVHACNSQGVWGSGIAKPFKEKYPHSYAEYQEMCRYFTLTRGTASGCAELSSHHIDENHHVGWIVTSHHYGDLKDDKELIKINTTLALYDLCTKIYHLYRSIDNVDVYSNKFNSGLFNVPWEESELILKTVLKDFKKINWIVCTPEDK